MDREDKITLLERIDKAIKELNDNDAYGWRETILTLGHCSEEIRGWRHAAINSGYAPVSRRIDLNADQ